MNRAGLLGCSLVAVAVLTAPQARAQAAAGSADPQSTAATESGASADLDGQDIVVTARRFSENAQDVPGALTAISGDALANMQITDTASLLRQIPGATLVTSGPSYISDISLRGQGGGRVGGSESATGLYRDGHYAAGGSFGGRSLNRLDLFDLDRLEVLRGPQGALYGRNAVGGSVNAIARKPAFGPANGWAKIGYDSFDSMGVEGALGIPLIDGKLAMRVAGFANDQSGGYITNMKTGNKVDRNSSTGLRVALAWRPADNIDTRLTFENFYTSTPAFGSLGYRATLNGGKPGDPSKFERILSTEAFAHIKQRTLYFDTTITTGYGDWHFNFDYKYRDGNRQNEDFAHFLGFEGVSVGGVLVDLRNGEHEIFRNGGGQIYLSSPKSLKGWSWVVGVDGLVNRSRDLTAITGQPGAPALRTQLRSDLDTERLRSVAFYATVARDLTDKLNFDLELRVQNDRKSIDFSRARSAPTSTAVPFSVDLTRSWTRVLPTAVLRYKYAPGQNVYARFATGYRPGGFNTGIPSDIPNAENLIPYDPEYVYGGELGWKGSFLGGALIVNLATYYTKTKNVLVVTAASATNASFILQNAGDNHVYGAELETRGRIKLGAARLDLSAALSTANGRFEKGTAVLNNTGVVTDISGFRVNQTRDLNVTLGATVTVPLGNRVVATLGANMQSASGGYDNALNTNKLDGYTLLDLNASLAIKRLKLSVWAKNIGNRVYLLQTVSSNQYFNAPKQYGGSISLSF